MLRPVTPFVEYAINYDYISKVLCINKDKPKLQCNGKCQLMKKLKQQKDDDYKSLRVSMEEYPIGFVTVLNLENQVEVSTTTTHFGDKTTYQYLFLSSCFHPPTC